MTIVKVEKYGWGYQGIVETDLITIPCGHTHKTRRGLVGSAIECAIRLARIGD